MPAMRFKENQIHFVNSSHFPLILIISCTIISIGFSITYKSYHNSQIIHQLLDMFQKMILL